MPDDFYPFVDSGDPAPDNSHIHPSPSAPLGGARGEIGGEGVSHATRIAVYDDMLSTPRVLVIEAKDVRTYLEEITNTVYRCMKEQGGGISLMVIREIVENFIHAHFVEPIISILDGGQTIRFADQGPGIDDKELAFEFGVTSADREKKRYIRGTGAGFPMVQQYLENAGGAISIEDNLGQGTVVTVSLDPSRVDEMERAQARGAAVRGGGYRPSPDAAVAHPQPPYTMGGAPGWDPYQQPMGQQMPGWPYTPMPQGGYAPIYQPGPQGYMQPGYPMPASYPTQQPGYGAMTPPIQEPSSGWGPQIHLSERGTKALGYLMQHGACGPTELAAAFGSSTPTWSRELDTLAGQGLVMKHGQKRILTEMGRIWAGEHQRQ